MGNFMVLLKKNLIEMVRNKRVLIFGVVFVLLAAVSALTAKFLPLLIEFIFESIGGDVSGSEFLILEANVPDSYLQFIANFSETSILLVGLMFVGTVIKEKKKGTYDSLKMNGVKDRDIVLSHFVAQIILVTVSYLFSVAVFVLLNILLFRQIMGVRGFVILLYVYLIMLITVCFSLFVSCICKKSGKAYLIMVLSYFVMSILEVIPKINVINPFHLLTLSSNLLYTSSYSLKEHLITSGVSLGVSVLLVLLSVVLVKNRINNKKVVVDDESERT